MKRNVILVIEDTADRVDFLKKHIEPLGYWVIWCTDVDDFVKEAERRASSIAMLVFDHDLGFAHPDFHGFGENETPSMEPLIKYDRTGKCGLDAARHEHVRAIPCIAVVWSWNDSGGRAIVDELARDSAATKVWRAPFRATDEYMQHFKRMLG